MIPSFVINLDDRIHRWEKFKNLKYKIERISAEDTRCDSILCLQKYNLSLLPSDKLTKYYFRNSKGAIGCYLSHYRFWKHIVDKKIEKAIVFEDDALTTDVSKLLDNHDLFNDLDSKSPVLIQFNKRTTQEKLPFWFNGTESYAVNLAAANSLIELTHDFSYMKGYKIEYLYDVLRTGVRKQDLENHWRSHDRNIDYETKNCIRYAADKFIGYCSHYAIPYDKRINILIKPQVGLYTNNVESDVNLNSKNWYDMSLTEILEVTQDL